MINQMFKTVFFIIILATAAFSKDWAQPAVFHLDSTDVLPVLKWKFQSGDSLRWAQPDFDDSQWIDFDIGKGAKIVNGYGWYRTRIKFMAEQDDFDFINLKLWGWTSAYEIYWDGRLLHTNGTLAKSKAEEVSGKIMSIIRLKRELIKPGEHVLAVRVSNFHPPTFRVRFYGILGYNLTMENNLNKYYNIHVFDFGLFVLTALFSIALFFGGGRQRPYFFFTIFALANAWYSAVSIMIYYFNLSVHFISLIRALTYLAAPLGTFFLNSFFIFNFNLPRKRIQLMINIAAILGVLIFFGHHHLAWLSLYSVGVIIYSVRQKAAGAWAALIGTAVYSVMQILYFYGIVYYTYILSEVYFIFLITLSLSRQIKAEHQKLEEAKLRSIRLESELLKKNIQPHFIMNTLLSIMSWITEDPKKAIRLIQALAKEFRMINKISGEKEIPLSEEIKLCETHLELMGYRKDASYQLIRNNLNPEEKVPPMIFHTLIENGLTHAFQSGENGTFKLTYTKNNGTIHYKLENDGSLLQKLNREPQGMINEGMGMKYVKTRLEESYPQRWHLGYGLNTEKWVVDISIEKN